MAAIIGSLPILKVLRLPRAAKTKYTPIASTAEIRYATDEKVKFLSLYSDELKIFCVIPTELLASIAKKQNKSERFVVFPSGLTVTRKAQAVSAIPIIRKTDGFSP